MTKILEALTFEDNMSSVTIPPSGLGNFLIERSLKNLKLGNFFFWYLLVECEAPKYRFLYLSTLRTFVGYLPTNNKYTERET